MNAEGRIELICGPMFSGKTTAMIARLAAARQAGFDVVAIKPSRDTRYGADRIVTHDGAMLTAVSVTEVREIASVVAGARVVGLDEIHFFEGSLIDVCRKLAGAGVRVVAAGVEIDHRGLPFEVVACMAQAAHEVIRLTATCARCGAAARHSQRLTGGDSRILVGGIGMYEPRCDRCFEPGL